MRNGLRGFRRVARRNLRKKLKDRFGRNRIPVFSTEGFLTKEPRPNSVSLIASGQWIIDDWPTAPLVPNHIPLRVPPFHKIGLSHNLLRGHGHEEGSIGPVSKKICVEPALFYQGVYKSKGKGAIRSRSNLEEHVRLARNTNAPGIHGHNLHPSRPGSHDIMGQDEGCRAWIMTPEEKGLAAGEIRRGKIRPKGVAECCVLVPVADVGRGYPIGAAKGIEKPRQPSFCIVHRGPASRPFGEGDGARTVALTYG